MPERKHHRRLWRRQQHLPLPGPIGVNFTQQLFQRAMLNAFRRVEVKVAAMKMETKRLKRCHKNGKAKLREMEASYTQLRAERRYALEHSACTQVCSDTMVAMLFAQAIGDFGLADQLQASLRELMMT